MIILQNELFGDYDFMNFMLKQFIKDKNNYFNIINKLYGNSYLKIDDLELIFKDNLLSCKNLNQLINIKANYFSLNFYKK